jgi:hypothetical protein
VTTSSTVVIQTINYDFKFVITSTNIEIVLKNNLLNGVFDLSNNNTLILNASESYDPEKPEN